MVCKNKIVKVIKVRHTVTGILALGLQLVAVQEANFEPGKSCMMLKRGFMNRLVDRLCLSLFYGGCELAHSFSPLGSQVCLTSRPHVLGYVVGHPSEHSHIATWKHLHLQLYLTCLFNNIQYNCVLKPSTP